MHVAEAYANQMFKPLRIDSQMKLWVSTVFLYSLAQIGGIPRPRPIERISLAERNANALHRWLKTEQEHLL